MNEHITNKMASVSVKKLMLSMGIPMVISLMLQALYNIVDSLFIANIQENAEAALNALTLAFPLQILMVATAIGTGVGANALLSRSLGQGDRDKASLTAGNAVFLGILFLLSSLYSAFSEQSFTPDLRQAILSFVQWHRIILGFAVFSHLGTCCLPYLKNFSRQELTRYALPYRLYRVLPQI